MSSLSKYENSRKSDAVKLSRTFKSISKYSHLSKIQLHNSFSAKRLRIELKDIARDTTSNISAHLKGDNLFVWEATIQGPPDSPYEGGTFLLDMIFSLRYPFEPPRVTFRTQIYHCNINSDGWISMSTLHEYYSPSLTVSKLLLSIQSLLTDCNPEDALVPEIAAQYVNDRQEYDRICREWTKKYATEEFGM